jgi:hypothetical protein
MADIWESWVSDQSVDEFLREIDAAVADGAFPDRKAAFVEYANCVLAELASARWRPHARDDGFGAGQLAELLLAHALAKEGRARREEVFTLN